MILCLFEWSSVISSRGDKIGIKCSLYGNDYSYTRERLNSKANVFLIISFIQIASFTQVLNKFQVQRLGSGSFLNKITHAIKATWQKLRKVNPLSYCNIIYLKRGKFRERKNSREENFAISRVKNDKNFEFRESLISQIAQLVYFARSKFRESANLQKIKSVLSFDKMFFNLKCDWKRSSS